MHNIIIIRYGEIALKGKNRAEFEKKLVRNIRQCLRKNNVDFNRIIRKRGRVYIETKEKCKELSNIFGIVSFSHANKLRFDIDKIKCTIEEFLKTKKFKTFRLSSHRVDKSISIGSQELNTVLGQFVVDKFDKKVSLKKYDIEIGVEIIEGSAYVFVDKTSGPTGLPYGVNGNAFAFIEDKKSLLAAWLMMKRGLKVIPIALKEKDISLIEKYNYGYKKLEIIKIGKFNEITDLARKMKIFCLITGDVLPDVTDYKLDLLVLRPLVGFSDQEIKDQLKNI